MPCHHWLFQHHTGQYPAKRREIVLYELSISIHLTNQSIAERFIRCYNGQTIFRSRSCLCLPNTRVSVRSVHSLHSIDWFVLSSLIVSSVAHQISSQSCEWCLISELRWTYDFKRDEVFCDRSDKDLALPSRWSVWRENNKELATKDRPLFIKWKLSDFGKRWVKKLPQQNIKLVEWRGFKGGLILTLGLRLRSVSVVLRVVGGIHHRFNHYHHRHL